MGYVAVRGGEQAIANAETLLLMERAGGASELLNPRQIREQLYLAVDRVMGEGSLYAPDLAALAFKQAAGDTFEAAFILRSYRTTLPRIGYAEPAATEQMRIVRRISAAFKEIPGGQILGPTADYTLRLLNFDLEQESAQGNARAIRQLHQAVADLEPLPESFPKVVETLRREGLLVARAAPADAAAPAFDITRQALSFPAPRSAQLQTLARGETGGLLALAYSNMRGYGSVHPVIGELRVGYLPLAMKHPVSGAPVRVGEIKVTEAEVIARLDLSDGEPRFTLGYGVCFGHNETKAIAMAVLDRAMGAAEPEAPSEDQEFVLTHVDGIESMGFCNHYKLPHYVTFQSDLDRLRHLRAASPPPGTAGGREPEKSTS
ncbi:MAG: carbon-phosphorus lyase complex subunit PhnI [Desulfobacterales bacterium]|jgi:alpha-D-ribose 1-methylphosphonate 5-triphosphate synthase subunit PhnI|nr:carbon-phosphorus lyase complex subunit PhnI [Desulfobacterales bacterium]